MRKASEMAKTISKVLLVTANVGSIFEDAEKMLPIWLREFLAIVTQLEPEMLAIHCQEVGGKNYEESMQHVNKFITLLLDSREMQQFDRARVFLDEDFTAVEKFTALGSLYFIHQSVRVVEIFDFHSKQFVPVEGKQLLTGNIEHVRIKEKAKFTQEFFPDFVWSRKGFIRTRWNLYNTKFDLVNVHLIHDVSNVAAMETSPSMYSKFREKALVHTIERFEKDQYEKYPFFIFGDFNFRMDTHRLIKELTQLTEEQKVIGKKNEVSKVLFKQSDNGNVVLTVGKKDFKHSNHNDLFRSDNAMKLQVFDNEPSACRDKLFEYQVTFPPSYPFSEDAEDGTSYMPTRCPGWCDRIMMSHNALDLIENNTNGPEYKMIGSHICMGDHKPIYLNVKIRHPPYPMTGNHQAEPSAAAGAILNGSADSESHVSLADTTDAGGDGDAKPLRREKAPLRPVISINGEIVEASPSEINIHDYVTFEQEDILTNEFLNSIKRHMSPEGEGGFAVGSSSRTSAKLKFKNAVSNLLKSDNVLKAMKHYSHRSDSETDTDDTDESPSVAHAATNQNGPGLMASCDRPADDSCLKSNEVKPEAGSNISGGLPLVEGEKDKVFKVENSIFAVSSSVQSSVSVSSNGKQHTSKTETVVTGRPLVYSNGSAPDAKSQGEGAKTKDTHADTNNVASLDINSMWGTVDIKLLPVNHSTEKCSQPNPIKNTPQNSSENCSQSNPVKNSPNNKEAPLIVSPQTNVVGEGPACDSEEKQSLLPPTPGSQAAPNQADGKAAESMARRGSAASSSRAKHRTCGCCRVQ